MTSAELRHGYTLAVVDDLAKRVVRNNLAWWPGGDRDSQHDTAWDGIVYCLYSAAAPPGRLVLLEAGRRALAAEVKSDMQARGTRSDGTNNGANFTRYWSWHAAPAPPWEEPLIDRVALTQIWAALTTRQQEAITALAASGDYYDAAAALGVEPQTFRSLIGRARKVFYALWHEGETPSRPWGCDRRVLRRETTDPAELAARARDAARARERRRERRAPAALWPSITGCS